MLTTATRPWAVTDWTTMIGRQVSSAEDHNLKLPTGTSIEALIGQRSSSSSAEDPGEDRNQREEPAIAPVRDAGSGPACRRTGQTFMANAPSVPTATCAAS